MWFLVLCIALTLGGTGAAPPIQPRIIGGWECKPHSQPWQVAVYNYNKPECGGVLIDPKWVLTAAHCTSKNYQLWLGRHSLEDPGEPGQYAQVGGVFPHPGFNKSNPDPFVQNDYSNDLMLLRLKVPAQITATVQVLALPTQEPQVGSTCLASGWGSIKPEGKVYPQELHCVDVNIYPNDVCAKAHPHKITDTMLCAGHIEGGKDTCVGDSGGPLICDGSFQGILSWGHNPCATVGKPAIFTSVFSFRDWIQDTMAANP
ncbi:kallikrein-1-like [Echinops telfairi]|uniref:Kallikrein-1-like n=1 Tax=Echinops telfairi TaxID=9371 RepID=A0ABM0IY72_ECHTE|nr:kallikrein-1-like [Echinops telfairi]